MHARKYNPNRDGERLSNAECSGCYTTLAFRAFAPATFCPRHDAGAYADHMARHATDSIR